ncbi:MAG: type II toxin-antitoxin system PemK/MazF family toxin [Elusimicrobia bacterium]|nr:type II toxin-antitoxin system PemK/MazF family toxin [Elusimicrobiota bacterium]
MDSIGFPLRGELYLLTLDKLRPAVVVSNNIRNEAARHITVAAVRSNPKAALIPECFTLKASATNGLDHDSVVDCGHLFTLDKSLFNRQLGRLEPQNLRLLNQAISISLALAPYDKH